MSTAVLNLLLLGLVAPEGVAAQATVPREPSATLTVEVVDATGAPLPSALVRIERGAAAPQPVPRDGGTTGFRLDGLAPGQIAIVAERDGFSPARTVVRIQPGETRAVRLVLHPASIVEQVQVTAGSASGGETALRM